MAYSGKKRDDNVIKPQFAKVPPHAIDAERAVLGGILLENSALNVVLEMLTPEDFYSDANGLVYGAMVKLFKRGEPVDHVTLREELAARKDLERVGGDEHLLSLIDTLPTIENIQAHAVIV